MTRRFVVEVHHLMPDMPGTPGWYWRIRYPGHRQSWSDWIGPFPNHIRACVNAAEEGMADSIGWAAGKIEKVSS